MNTTPLRWFEGMVPMVYGVDWLTITTPRENAGAFDAARTMYCQHEELVTELDGREATIRDFIGRQWGKCFIGSNKTHTMMQITSFVPWDVFVDAASRHSTNVTRVDLQITCASHRTKGATGRLFFEHLVELSENGDLDERLHVDKHESLVDVETVYIGRPSSDRRFRFYNKTIQEKTYDDEPTRWRLELQLRREVAVAAAAKLLHEWQHGRYIAVPHIVLGQLSDWNVDADMGYPLLGLDVHQPQKIADMQKKFTWISEQCVPTIRKLLDDDRLGGAMEELLLHLIAQRL